MSEDLVPVDGVEWEAVFTVKLDRQASEAIESIRSRFLVRSPGSSKPRMLRRSEVANLLLPLGAEVYLVKHSNAGEASKK